MTAEPSRTSGRARADRDWTWADLQEIPDDGHRYEIIDGSLHVSPEPEPTAPGRRRPARPAAGSTPRPTMTSR